MFRSVMQYIRSPVLPLQSNTTYDFLLPILNLNGTIFSSSGQVLYNFSVEKCHTSSLLPDRKRSNWVYIFPTSWYDIDCESKPQLTHLTDHNQKKEEILSWKETNHVGAAVAKIQKCHMPIDEKYSFTQTAGRSSHQERSSRPLHRSK